MSDVQPQATVNAPAPKKSAKLADDARELIEQGLTETVKDLTELAGIIAEIEKEYTDPLGEIHALKVKLTLALSHVESAKTCLARLQPITGQRHVQHAHDAVKDAQKLAKAKAGALAREGL